MSSSSFQWTIFGICGIASPLPLMLVLIWYISSIPIVLRCSTPYTTILQFNFMCSWKYAGYGPSFMK